MAEQKHDVANSPMFADGFGAQQVLARLDACASSEAAFEMASKKHALFSRLYYFTTRQWLNYAQNCVDPELVLLMVEHFFELYEDYVLNTSDRSNSPYAHHWHIHVKLLSHQDHKPAMALRGIALFFGIRAHTRFDLAEAICRSRASYIRRHGKEPDMTLFRSLLFGKEVNRLFRDASLDFIASSSPPNARNTSVIKLAALTSWMWMPLFQSARRAAWREAINSITLGKVICRSPPQSAAGCSYD